MTMNEELKEALESANTGTERILAAEVRRLTAELAGANKGWQCGGPDQRAQEYDLLLSERKEVGEACDRMENSWKAYAYENGRIHSVLEKLCEARHGTRMIDADLLCDSIDSALMEIWGNTVGPANKPLLSGKKCGHGPEMLKVVDLYCAQCVKEK